MCGNFSYESIRSHYLSIYISFIVPLCAVLYHHVEKEHFCVSAKLCWLVLGWRGVNDMFYVTGLEAIHVDNFKEFGFYSTKIGF